MKKSLLSAMMPFIVRALPFRKTSKIYNALILIIFILSSCSISHKTESDGKENAVSDTAVCLNHNLCELDSSDIFKCIQDVGCADIDSCTSTNAQTQNKHDEYVTLKMEIVEINPNFSIFFSDYLVPLVKHMSFDSMDNFIFVSGNYIGSNCGEANNENISIFITISFCGMKNSYAEKILNNEFKIAFINGVPIIFDNFNFNSLISCTGNIYEWRKWRKKDPFSEISMCDSEAYFDLEAENGRIYFHRCMDDFGFISDLVPNMNKYLPPRGWINKKSKHIDQINSANLMSSDSISKKMDSMVITHS